VNQILIMNPLSLPLWVAGLWYFFSKGGARYRVFSWAYLILFALFIAIQGKSYFLAPAYPPLFAGGALASLGIQIGRCLRHRACPEWRAPGSRGDASVAPAVYAQVYGAAGNGGSAQESGDVYGLPQALADRSGCEKQVALIAQIYHSLAPDEQRVACVFTENYGEASALVQFGARYHLPPAISGHNAFNLWGQDGYSRQVLITINISPQDAAQGYGSVTLAARTSCAACVTFENNAPILILRQPKEPFAALWRQAKHFD
jgi:hypothetical protein